MQRMLSTIARTTPTLALALGMCLAAGCGGKSGLDKVTVTGNVTFDGTPIANGEIRFFPIEGTKGPVSGAPIRDGQYTAEAKGGVPVGKHRVEIRGFRASSRGLTGEAAVEGGPAEQYLPARYNVTTELTAEVDDDHTQQDFTLTTSG